MSYEVTCNLNEIKLHHKYTLIYAMILTKQSFNIQINIGLYQSHNNILLLQRKLNAVATFPVKLQYTKKPSPTGDPYCNYHFKINVIKIKTCFSPLIWGNVLTP